MDRIFIAQLQDQPTSELDKQLNCCLQQDDLWNYEDTVRAILAILAEREKNTKFELTPQLEAAWQRYLEKTGHL